MSLVSYLAPPFGRVQVPPDLGNTFPNGPARGENTPLFPFPPGFFPQLLPHFFLREEPWSPPFNRKRCPFHFSANISQTIRQRRDKVIPDLKSPGRQFPSPPFNLCFLGFFLPFPACPSPHQVIFPFSPHKLPPHPQFPPRQLFLYYRCWLMLCSLIVTVIFSLTLRETSRGRAGPSFFRLFLSVTYCKSHGTSFGLADLTWVHPLLCFSICVFFLFPALLSDPFFSRQPVS